MLVFTLIATGCTEASNQKSKYAYRKIFFNKKHWKCPIVMQLQRNVLLSVSQKLDNTNANVRFDAIFMQSTGSVFGVVNIHVAAT